MIQGNWWIPDNEEKMLPGILSFANNEIHLELSGQLFGDSLEELPDDPLELFRAREIHGVASGGREANDTEKSLVGKRIILQNCSEINRKFHWRITASTFSAAVAYAVQNSQDAKDLSLKFHEIRVGFSHLPDFAITEGRLVRHDWKFGKDKRIEGLTASFNYQTLPTAKINGKTLEFWQNVKHFGDGKRKFVVEPRVAFKIRSEEALSLQEWHTEFIIPLQHFLTLATTQVNRVTSLEAFHNDNVETIELSPRDKRIQTIPFNIITEETLQFGSVDFSEALFRLFDLRDIKEFEKVMMKWFQLYDDHGTRMVQNLLFTSLSNFNMGDRFLNLARALEVYYRAKYSDEEMPRNEFRARREKILEQV